MYKESTFSVTRIFLSTLLTFLISSTSTYFISFFAYSRGVLLMSTLISCFLLISWRLFFKVFNERRALIIGGDKKSFEIGREIQKSPDTKINIFLGKIEYIKGIIIKNRINEVIIREEHIQTKGIFKIIKSLNDLKLSFKIIPKENNIILSKGEIEQISGIDLMSYEIPFLERGNILIITTA